MKTNHFDVCSSIIKYTSDSHLPRKTTHQMNESYVILIVGALTSALVAFSLLLDESSIDIKSVTRNIEDGN
jgi:hypothetical protein